MYEPKDSPTSLFRSICAVLPCAFTVVTSVSLHGHPSMPHSQRLFNNLSLWGSSGSPVRRSERRSRPQECGTTTARPEIFPSTRAW
ncbi:hypothetical protein ACFFX0_13315 [Citricoccus parietis]|uniref:Secreted protein n=1 Tax=Citricoccus parietis TaxID=592307 RepID=A0ABV5FZL6_9MICC